MPSYRSDQLAVGRIHGWHVYVIAEPQIEFCKIGSASNIGYRLSTLQGGNPRKLVIAKSWHCDDRAIARAVEAAALDDVSERRVQKSEWVKCAPWYAIEAVERVIRRLDAKLRLDAAPIWSRA